VVGVSYASDYRTDVYFDPEIDKITTSIAKALTTPSKVWIADASVDEKKLLLFSASDDDPASTICSTARPIISTPSWSRARSWKASSWPK